MENYYFNIIDSIFNNIEESNKNILFIIKNEFHIFDNFSHIIKKKNIQIDIIINNNDYVNILKEEIEGEECDSNINIYTNIENMPPKLYDIITIFHVDGIYQFEVFLKNIHPYIYINTYIFIYCSLSNEKNGKIQYKNYFRTFINIYTNINVGHLINLNDMLKTIKKNNYNVVSFKVHKKNNYLFYGDNIVYETIINKN
jgi:hypothetical protein